MGSVFLPIDKCVKENGCLQVLVGSHKLGRIDHVHVEKQKLADLERVEQIKKICPLLHVELDPGDVLFFHSNLLHTSGQNHSDMRRWVFIISYNTKRNDPVVKHHHAQYHPLNMVENKQIMKSSSVSTVDKLYMKIEDDISTQDNTIQHLKK